MSSYSFYSLTPSSVRPPLVIFDPCVRNESSACRARPTKWRTGGGKSSMSILNKPGQRASMSVQALFGFLSLFAALCTIFALVVTVAEGWTEHAESSWPAASASIQHCALDTYVRVRNGMGIKRSRITCDIQYAVNGEDVQARLHSASSSSDKDISRMQHWVSEHATGKSIEIHRDPSNSKNAVLTETDMPFAGPH